MRKLVDNDNGRKRRRSQRSIQTEQTLLKHAKRIFSESGFEQATTKDIAKAAQVAEGTLFHHFPNKMRLLEGLMVNLYQHLQAKAEEISGLEEQAIARFRALVINHLTWSADNWEILRIVVQYGRYGNKEFAEAFYQLNKQYTKLFVNLIEELKDELKIRRTTPTHLIRDTIFGSVEHFLIGLTYHNYSYELEAFTDQLLDLIFFGCGGQQGHL